MNIVKRALKAIRDAKQQRMDEKEFELRRRLRNEMEKRIQVMEHEGNLFLAIDGTPIMDVSHLKGEIVKELADARQTATAYKLKISGHDKE